ncbi:MAG TPA: hypothetical protein VGO47_08505 [Chlamydiales bacterium]|nr:hypothetical protein [Chlamydiales bacterium]
MTMDFEDISTQVTKERKKERKKMNKNENEMKTKVRNNDKIMIAVTIIADSEKGGR